MIQVRQSKAASEAARAKAQAEATERLLALGLRPDDTIRFPRQQTRGSKVSGRPLDVAADGSVSCSAGGKLRAIRPEFIEVKMRGPRDGVQWVPLIPREEVP